MKRKSNIKTSSVNLVPVTKAEAIELGIKAGDIVLTRSGSFLSQGIQFFMNLYRQTKGLPKRKLFSHVAVVVDLYGQLYVAEAIGKGVQVIPDAQAYIDQNDCQVMTWVKPLNKQEQSRISSVTIDYALKPHRYDVLNFYYSARFVLTGKWRGPVGPKSERRVYCSELAAIAMDKTRGTFKGVTWDKNPLDIELCDELRKV